MKKQTDEKNIAEEKGVPVARARFCLDVFFALMLLFNGVAMLKSAQQLEFDKTHDFWVAVLRPLERFSRFSGLYRMRSVTEATLGAWLNRPVQMSEEAK